MVRAKNYKTTSTCVEVMPKKTVASFFRTQRIASSVSGRAMSFLAILAFRAFSVDRNTAEMKIEVILTNNISFEKLHKNFD